MNSIDLDSPVPLYHQIAEDIRARIHDGELAPGDSLKPIREAAKSWKVNFHTVRHAYTELARDGLVEKLGPRGTRVALISKIQSRKRKATDVDSFLKRTLGRFRSEFGLSPSQVAKLIKLQAQEEPTGQQIVHVVECSEHQCQDLCQQIESAWDVKAVPWCLDQQGDLPAESLIATYFHYNEIRVRWPRRMSDVSFVSIAPASQLGAQLNQKLAKKRRIRLTVCERDQPTADAVAADISALLRVDHAVGTKVIKDPKNITLRTKGEVFLIPPRVWGSLSNSQKGSDRIIEIRYVFDAMELESIAHSFGWNSTRPVAKVNS